jgi:hypothetical protein
LKVLILLEKLAALASQLATDPATATIAQAIITAVIEGKGLAGILANLETLLLQQGSGTAMYNAVVEAIAIVKGAF